jgi:hypothetical protein
MTKQVRYVINIVNMSCPVDRASWYNLVNRTNLVRSFSYVFIAFLYMFRETMCPSSGEKYRTYATPGICQFIWMTLWYAGWNEYQTYQTVIHIN